MELPRHLARTIAPIAALLLQCASASGEQGRSAEAVYADEGAGRDWPGFGRSYGEQHYSHLTQLDTASVAKLGLAWSYDLPPGNSLTGPVAAKGVLFTATGYSVVRAFEVATGKLLWEVDTHAAERAGPRMRNGWGIRGLAWWHDKIYVGTQDGRLLALDAGTGHTLWSRQTLEKEWAANITGAPRIFDGKVIIGFGGADFDNVRGYVTAYDAENGRQLWRFYTVPGNPATDRDETTKRAAATWTGKWWEFGGGGTVWNAMTYDPETETIFIGTGNGAPWNHRVRSPGGGDNLFLCSIVALDAKSGRYKWHYQINPAETWDYNAAMDMPLATLTIEGSPRKVIMQAPKNGFFYVIDRLNGHLISAEPFARTNWASRIDLATGRPQENSDARFPEGKTFEIWPSPGGAHNWLPMAFSPRTGLVYIPTANMAAEFSDRGIDKAHWSRRPGSDFDGALYMGPPGPAAIAQSETFLQAWDPAKQRRVWTLPGQGAPMGGVLATAGGLVFQGRTNGRLLAIDDITGKILWSFAGNDPILGPPISYEWQGIQYVSVVTGLGTSYALNDHPRDYRSETRRVLTFRLGGTAKLESAPEVTAISVEPDPGFRADVARQRLGMVLFGKNCSLCHGPDAVGHAAAPDLRTSPVPLLQEAFQAVVTNGALVKAGMPRFDHLTGEEVADIRQYLRSRRPGLVKPE